MTVIFQFTPGQGLGATATTPFAFPLLPLTKIKKAGRSFLHRHYNSNKIKTALALSQT